MSAKQISKFTMVAGKILEKAVYEELKKKALLGQNVVIERNGKACRIPAKEALKIARSKSSSKSSGSQASLSKPQKP